MDLTVYIVDDDDAVRESLTFLMRAQGFICRSYASAAAFLEQLRPEQHGCIISDIRMPGVDGIELINHLRAIECRMPVVVITGHADVPLAVRAMKAGVADFIEKPFESDAIVATVRRCLASVRERRSSETHRAAIKRRVATLTERETQVFSALFDGKSNKSIALELDISPRTVEIYRANVMSKMQADSLPQLVKMKMTISA